MMDRNFVGNAAAFSAAALFGASVVATRVAVGSIPPLLSLSLSLQNVVYYG